MLFTDDHRTTIRRMTAIRWSLRASGLLIALAIVGAAWGGHSLLQRYLASLKSEHSAAVALIENRQTIVRQHAELEADVEAQRKDYASLLQRIPATASEGDFLRELSAIASECDLVIRDFRPGRIASHETHSEQQIQLRAEGSHASLCRFLVALQSTHRMSRVSHLTVGPANPKNLVSAIDIHIQVAFDAKLKATI